MSGENGIASIIVNYWDGVWLLFAWQPFFKAIFGDSAEHFDTRARKFFDSIGSPI